MNPYDNTIYNDINNTYNKGRNEPIVITLYTMTLITLITKVEMNP